MQQKQYIIILICVAVAFQGVLGRTFQDLPASRKQELINRRIERNDDNIEFYTSQQNLELFTQNNNSTMDIFDDFLWFQNESLRKKIIHTVGLTADCSFVSTGNHKFTGIFKGAEHGIVRFSQNGLPNANFFNPAFSFKFFRDGVHSANLISLYNLYGQGPNSNPFAHDHSTHVPLFNIAAAPLQFKALAQNFQSVSPFPTILGHSDAALYGEDGQKVENPEFPYRIVFHPTKEAHEAISPNIDMGEDPYFFIDEMDGLLIEHLFDVYAQLSPDDDEMKLVKIGEIRQNSSFTPSRYGDKRLFFQHPRFENDVKYKPEWGPKAGAILKQQETIVPVLFRQDLPFV